MAVTFLSMTCQIIVSVLKSSGNHVLHQVNASSSQPNQFSLSQFIKLLLFASVSVLLCVVWRIDSWRFKPSSFLWSSCARGNAQLPYQRAVGVFTSEGRQASHLTSCFLSVLSHHTGFHRNIVGNLSEARRQRWWNLL